MSEEIQEGRPSAGERMGRVVCWNGLGTASAVATKMMLNRGPARAVHCETGAEHPDQARFKGDLERWYGQPVEVIRSEEYADTWDVWEKRRFISGPEGAPCTAALKVIPRLAYQRPDDIHVFGYTADANDVARAKRLREHFFELRIETPLIDAGITKAGTMTIVEAARIKLPVMYKLGFHNNNCIPCGKATSPNYWANIRKHFPSEFARMVTLSRELGARLTRINDERIFIDEIPSDWPTTNPIAPSCDFLCQIAAQDLETA